MGHHQTSPIFLVGGKRTPFGKFGGSLAAVTPLDLCVYATEALLGSIGVRGEQIDQVIVANVIPSTPSTLYCARHLALKLGMPVETPGLMVNRLCGSGLEAIIQAKRLIQLGEAEAILVAGVENMSMIPHLLHGTRFGTKYGGPRTGDLLLDTLTDQLAGIPMGETAENLAKDFNLSREDSDRFAFNSHQKASKAWSEGLFDDEVIKINVGKSIIKQDEHLRADADLSELSQLRPSFRKDGVVTPGSASGIVDGAAAVLIASEAFVSKWGLIPLATVGESAVVGVDPTRMGIGPVPAIKNLLKKTGSTIDQVQFLEINEAFAPQALACVKALDYPLAQFNIWGGAVALGHPLGASGVRIALTLARQLRLHKAGQGIASACIGGGQGIALCLH